MSAIRMVKNQFLGINPHLHSLWQLEGEWKGFHTAQIVGLIRALRAELLPIGYTAHLENSLQMRLTGSKPYQAIVVYWVRQSDRTPVAWIELLSPTNKPKGRHALGYEYKCTDLIDTGLVVMELDYLHESPPTIFRVADYRKKEQGAHPYRILVFDPHPHVRKGKTYVSQFDVDAPIPTVTIPLSGNDKLDFDFNAPYQKTFEEMLYGLELVDYSQLPANLDRYSQDDQAQIFTRLLAVRANGEQVPTPLAPLSYEEAAARWGAAKI